MKTKMIYYLIGFLVVIGLASCSRKDQTCACTVDGEITYVVYNQETKKNAEKACDAREAAAKLVDAAASCKVSN